MAVGQSANRPTAEPNQVRLLYATQPAPARSQTGSICCSNAMSHARMSRHAFVSTPESEKASDGCQAPTSGGLALSMRKMRTYLSRVSVGGGETTPLPARQWVGGHA